MAQNTNPGYWYESAAARHLAEKYERPLPLVCGELAYSAGDYADMSDDEVIETWVNDEGGDVVRVMERRMIDDCQEILDRAVNALSAGLSEDADCADAVAAMSEAWGQIEFARRKLDALKEAV